MRKIRIITLVYRPTTLKEGYSTVSQERIVSWPLNLGVIIVFFKAFIVHRSRNAGVFADKFEGIMSRLSAIIWFVFRDGHKPFILSGFIRIVGGSHEDVLVFLFIIVFTIDGWLRFGTLFSN